MTETPNEITYNVIGSVLTQDSVLAKWCIVRFIETDSITNQQIEHKVLTNNDGMYEINDTLLMRNKCLIIADVNMPDNQKNQNNQECVYTYDLDLTMELEYGSFTMTINFPYEPYENEGPPYEPIDFSKDYCIFKFAGGYWRIP